MFGVFVNAHKVSCLLFSCCSRRGWINCRSCASMTSVLDQSRQSPWKAPETYTRPVPKLLDDVQAALWCCVQTDSSAHPAPSATSPTMRVYVCQGCCKWFQLQAVFAVSLLLFSLPQMLDFNSTESCWPSVWFSWSLCQQGNRDGSPLSVGGEVTPAATNELAWQAFYFCLPVFQHRYTKHECFVNILIKDSSGFLFSPPTEEEECLRNAASNDTKIQSQTLHSKLVHVGPCRHEAWFASLFQDLFCQEVGKFL